ncbi:MAG: hypothetical protein QF473_30245, partial [Planctomycetota bacterium]|nr:hypothetical protein [Planctomycetota bacterium]
MNSSDTVGQSIPTEFPSIDNANSWYKNITEPTGQAKQSSQLVNSLVAANPPPQLHADWMALNQLAPSSYLFQKSSLLAPTGEPVLSAAHGETPLTDLELFVRDSLQAEATPGILDFSLFDEDLTFLVYESGEASINQGAFGSDHPFTPAGAAAFTAADIHTFRGGKGKNSYIFEDDFILDAFIDGSAGLDELVVLGADSTWDVTGENSGSVGRIHFSGVEVLTGGPDNEDTFIFHKGGNISGVIDGNEGGFDTLIMDDGDHETISYAATSPHDGTINRDGNTIT